MYEEENPLRKIHIGKVPTIIAVVAVIIVVVLVIASFSMFYSVGVGEAALLIDPISGTISEPVLGPIGAPSAFKAPWVSVVKVYLATDSLGMWGDGSDPTADYPAIAAFSKDQLEMTVDATVRWSINIDKVKQLYTNFPNINYKDTAIAPIVREQFRFVTKNYTAVQTVEQRELIARQIQEKIVSALAVQESLANAIINVEVDLRNIGLPQAYIDSIEQKLVAEQLRIQAGFEAETILILANATAEQQIIEAQGTSQARIIEANGTRDAINQILTIGSDISEEQIAKLYLWLEAMKDLDVPVILMGLGEDGLPIIIQVPTTP